MLLSFVRGAPALLIKKEKTLVVGDLHIGLSIRFKHSGIYFQGATERLAARLLDLYRKTGARKIVMLGDIKESVTSPSFEEYKELRSFFGLLADVEISIVKGNHDGNLQRILKNIGFEMQVQKEVFVGDTALTHGNAWPSEQAMMHRYVVVGHGHYAMRRGDRVEKVWLVSGIGRNMGKKYDKYNRLTKLVVAPSFNELVIGSPISDETKGYLPLFKNDVFSFERSKVYDLESRFAGTVSEIIRQD